MLWRTIEDFEKAARTNVSTSKVWHKLHAIKRSEYSSATEYCHEILELVCQIELSGVTHPEQSLAHFMMAGLPNHLMWVDC
jgi:hypothetical protein